MKLAANHCGFMLLELLVVVAIVALLATILLPSLFAAKELAKVVAAKADLNAVAKAVEAYGVEYEAFPPMRTYCWGGYEENQCPLPAELAEARYLPIGSDRPSRRCAMPDRFHPVEGVTYKYRAPGPTIHNDAPGGPPALIWVPDEFPYDSADIRAAGEAYNNVNYPVGPSGQVRPSPVAWAIWSVGPRFVDHTEHNYLMPVPREFWYRGRGTKGLITCVRMTEGQQHWTD